MIFHVPIQAPFVSEQFFTLCAFEFIFGVRHGMRFQDFLGFKTENLIKIIFMANLWRGDCNYPSPQVSHLCGRWSECAVAIWTDKNCAVVKSLPHCSQTWFALSATKNKIHARCDRNCQENKEQQLTSFPIQMSFHVIFQEPSCFIPANVGNLIKTMHWNWKQCSPFLSFTLTFGGTANIRMAAHSYASNGVR